MSELYESMSSSRPTFPLLGDDNFGPWRQRMSDQLKELDLWWILSGREVAPDKESTDAAVVAAYNKYLRKCFRITAKIRNAMEPHICAQYTSDTYDEDPQSLWAKLEEGYRKALGLELYYFRRSLFECSLETYGTAAKFVHEIERIIECLREAEELIKPREKTFYLLNGLPPSWREWCDLQATVIQPDHPENLIAAIKARESAINRDKAAASTGDSVLAVKGPGKSNRFRPMAPGSGIGRQAGRQAGNESSIVCYYCQKKGHRRSECRKLKSDMTKGINGEGITTAAQAGSASKPSNFLFTALSSTSASSMESQWLLDSGCSTHVTGSRQGFTSYVQIPDGEHKIRVANNAEVSALGRGDVTLDVWDSGKRCSIKLVLKGVLHVPACGRNSLLSVSQLRRSGVFVEFARGGGASLAIGNGSWIDIMEIDGLYVLRIADDKVSGHLGTKALAVNTEEGAAKEMALWHFRLAHLGADAVQKLSLEHNDIPKLQRVPRCLCTGCVYGKMARKPFPSVLSSSRATRPLELIHSDIAGPMDPKSLGGARYLLMFTDDFTRYRVGYLLKRKSEALTRFKELKALVEKQQDLTIRKLRTDGGGEYTSNEFCQLLLQDGIEIQRTTPYTPQSNGVSEQSNRTVIGTTRAILHAVNAPKHYWAEAAMTAIYVRNRLPTQAIQAGSTPYELWHQKKPTYDHLRVWGCIAYAQVPKGTRKKIDKTARKCMFIGYTDTTSQYRLYDPAQRRFFVSRDVVFEESKSYYNTSDTVGQTPKRYFAAPVEPWEEQLAWGDEFDEEEASQQKVQEQEEVFDWGDAEEILAPFRLHKPRLSSSSRAQPSGGDGDGDDDGDDTIERGGVPITKKRRESDTPRMIRGLRADTDSSYWESQEGELPVTEGMGSLYSRKGNSKMSDTSSAMVSAVYMVEAGPSTYKAAMESDEACEWQEAIDLECASLEKNDVLTFVDKLPDTKKAIPTKMILQRKLNPVGQTIRYKARLVAQGFRQVQGLDFTDTFAPVASLASVRVVLSIAAARGYTVRQMDVVTAFLGSTLQEEVYVTLPVGVFGEHRLASLNRSLYGLKQSPRCWYTTIDSYLIGKMGFRRGRFDCCIYTHDDGTILALYVDDMLIAGRLEAVELVCGKLQGKFEMVDLGPVSHFLGMVVSRDEVSRTVNLTQEGYIGRVLERFGMANCRTVGTPMEKDKPELKGGGDKLCDRTYYLQLIGSLGWIATGTRPDIAFTVSYLGRFNSEPTDRHLLCAKRVLRYLAGTKKLRLSLGGDMRMSMSLSGFVDADFAGEASSLKSTSGYIFFMGTGTIQWHSKRQAITATSTANAEFIASASAIQEIVWYRNLIREIGRFELPVSTLYNDNQASLSTFKDTSFKPHSKHIGVRVHQIREFIEDGKEVTMGYCGTNDMIADGLTKPLVLSKHVQFVRMCGLS